jgi:hypothetical protein
MTGSEPGAGPGEALRDEGRQSLRNGIASLLPERLVELRFERLESVCPSRFGAQCPEQPSRPTRSRPCGDRGADREVWISDLRGSPPESRR